MESVRSASIARADKSRMESNLDSNGNQVKSDTSKSTRTVINKIKNRIETGNLIVVPTTTAPSQRLSWALSRRT